MRCLGMTLLTNQMSPPTRITSNHTAMMKLERSMWCHSIDKTAVAWTAAIMIKATQNQVRFRSGENTNGITTIDVSDAAAAWP